MSSSIFERYRLPFVRFRVLPSSFFNGVHPLPIRIIIRPLRTASFYASSYTLVACDRARRARKSRSLISSIDGASQPSASHFSVNGLGKLGRFVRSCKMKLRDKGQMERAEENCVKKMRHFERELRRTFFLLTTTGENGSQR